MTVFRKTNRLARKSIIVYVRKLSFEHEDADGNKEKEAHLLEYEVSDWLLIWSFEQEDADGNKEKEARFTRI